MPRHVAILSLILVATNVLSAPVLQDDGLGLEWNFHASGMNDEDPTSDTETNSPQKQQIRETTNQLYDPYETEHYFNGVGQQPVLETKEIAFKTGKNQRRTQESKTDVSYLVTPTTTFSKTITESVEPHRSIAVRQEPESSQSLEKKAFSVDEVNLPNSRRMSSRNALLSTIQLAKFSDSSTSECDDPSLDLHGELSLTSENLAPKDSSSREKLNGAIDTGQEVSDLLMTFHDPIPMVSGDTIDEDSKEHVDVPINPYLVKRDLQNSVVLRWINKDRLEKFSGPPEDAFDWGIPRSENVSEDSDGVHMFSNYYKELVRKYKTHRNDSMEHQKTPDPRFFQEFNVDPDWNKLQMEQNDQYLKSNLTDENNLFSQQFTNVLQNTLKEHQYNEESFYPMNRMDEFPGSLDQNYYPLEYKTLGDEYHMLPQYSKQELELPSGKEYVDLPYSEGIQFAGNNAEESSALSNNQFRKYTLGLTNQGIVPPNYWFEEPRVDPYRNPLYKKLHVNRNMINDPEFLKKLEKYRDQKRRKMSERERQRSIMKSQMLERERRIKQHKEKVFQNMEEQRAKQGRRKDIQTMKLIGERKPLLNIFHKIFPPHE